VYLQRRKSAREVRTVDGDAPVKAAGAQQRLVEHLGAVRGREDDDALAGVEAVHLREELVERLLTLVVAAAEAAVARLADGIDLVDEDDARRDLRGLLEQIAHAARADADEHLHKARAADGEERDARLARHGLGQQRLAGTGRADEQRALRQLRADGGVASGVVQEVDDLLERLLRLVLTGDVLKRDAGGLLHIDLGVGLADVADAAESAAAVFGEHAQDEHEQADHQDRRQDIGDHELEDRAHLRLIGAGILDPVLIEQRQQVRVRQLRGIEREPLLVGLGIALAVLVGEGIAVDRRGIDRFVLEFDGLDLVGLDHLDELAVLDLVAGGLVGGVAGIGVDILEHHDQNQRPQDQRGHPPHPAAVVLVVFLVLIGIHIYLLPPQMGMHIE